MSIRVTAFQLDHGQAHETLSQRGRAHLPGILLPRKELSATCLGPLETSADVVVRRVLFLILPLYPSLLLKFGRIL